MNSSAFPQILHSGISDPGMTLRDYFAAAALDGLTAVTYLDIDELARTAYALADAMLEAREASE